MTFDKLLNFILQYWFSIALLFSSYYGIRFYWQNTRDNKLKYNNKSKSCEEEKMYPDNGEWKCFSKTLCYYHFVHAGIQFTTNFIGSFFGWICFYILLNNYNNLNKLNKISFGWDDLILFIFSLLGLTGHLPQVMGGFIDSFAQLGNALANRIMKK